eukprot:CAMPEP_0201664852 /NCGR_PEP_ID=MMETSP0494-20130426/6191_1 /ASSEMBLY_ACC=CAM_ASM_000839 /TAXON_ID=420259 /ORGANISM="Thalassiosira gravida, Strain GMp14c1" /LENGTH=277 /DNA_ID=CAMNT_0048143705 /DNA_START=257 /DNA_END=1088 /DNA_ORIENTATION=+
MSFNCSDDVDDDDDGDVGDSDDGRRATEPSDRAWRNAAPTVAPSYIAMGDDASSTPRESTARTGKRRSSASSASSPASSSSSGREEVEWESQSTTEARTETREAVRGTSTIASDALRAFRNSILSKVDAPMRSSPSSPPPAGGADSNDDEYEYDDRDRRDPRAVIDVARCGIPEINGRYHRFEIIDGVPSYSKIESYEGKEAIFTIGRWNSNSNDNSDNNNDNDNDDDNNNDSGTSSSKKWHVTATIPHREKELAFYVAYAPSFARHPPSKNWMVVE